MSLLEPELGEMCRCYQCKTEGEIGPSPASSAFIIDPRDGAVICSTCHLCNPEPVDGDVERIPEEKP